ncbi:MAG: FtsX-like permease family protein, partial [Oscillospiraceae bacterium]
IDILIGNNYVSFDIIGVVQTGGNITQNIMGGYIPSFVYIPCTTMQKYLFQQEYDKIAFTLNEDVDEQLFQKVITDQLSEEVGIKNAYVSQNLNSTNQEVENITKLVSKVLTAIAGISLVVATMSVMTIMFSAAKERTKEIGIKKAIGASRSVILTEFAAEIFTLGFIGSIIGSTLAFLILMVFGGIFGVKFEITFMLLFKFSVITITLSMLFGIYPAYKASKLNVVDALRYN